MKPAVCWLKVMLGARLLCEPLGRPVPPPLHRPKWGRDSAESPMEAVPSPEARQRAAVAGSGREGPGQAGAATSPEDSQPPAPVLDAGAAMVLHSWCSCVTHAVLSSPIWCTGLDLSASRLLTLNFNAQMAFTYK